MNYKIFCILALFILVTGNILLAENQTSNIPSAVVVNDVFEFNPVLEGTEVVNDFIIKNKGTAPLEILNVETDWGCTAVSYTRQIPPGGEGKITIEVDTSGNGGKRLKKNISVDTNDPHHQKLTLTVTGVVEKLVTIKPKWVRLKGSAGQQIRVSVIIIPEEKYPFKIYETKAKNGKLIRYSLMEDKSPNGLRYVLTVENLKKEKGRYKDTIYLKTTSKYRPVININVYGNIV